MANHVFIDIPGTNRRAFGGKYFGGKPAHRVFVSMAYREPTGTPPVTITVQCFPVGPVLH